VRIDRLGEDRLIRLIQRTVRPRGRVRLGIGDDACILGGGTVLTTDAYAEGVHFDLSYLSCRDVGRRCACGAISDVVAMAAEPEALLVALCVPPRTPDRDVRDLYRGIEQVCRQLNCEVAGGDVVAFDRLVLTLTATGTTRAPRLRSAARPGDVVYLTGHAGLAETGRLVLAGNTGRRVSPAPRRRVSDGWRTAVARHLLPLPRIEVMRRLRPRIRALIDTSDGLATDARHLAEMSRVRVELDAAAIPVAAATRRLCALRGLDPLGFALGAGEDYELLFTGPARLPARVASVAVTAIGTVKTGSGLWLAAGAAVRPLETRGYDHLGPH